MYEDKVPDTWRKPKGIQSKQRHNIKSRGARPKVGYKNALSIRNLDRGKINITISSIRQLESLESSQHRVYIASSVGRKKRLVIMAEAEKKGIQVGNAARPKYA